MSNALTTVSHFVNKYAYAVLLTLFVLWMLIGVFPLQCYETDGQEIILGCDVMYREGWTLPPVYSYEYRMQPLITLLIVALKHLLPFLTCEQIYCMLTVVASLVFLIGCIVFAEHVTKASKTRILVAAMLLPEMYAIAMYPNTAIPSVACFLWALILMSRERYWQSGLLMCVAILFRLDIVIVFPTILPLLIFERKQLKGAIGVSVVYGLTVVLTALFFFWVMRADALSTFYGYQKWNHIITPMERILAIVGFYSLAYFVLLPLGICVMAGKKHWTELFLVLTPILLLHGVYASFGNASKHFLYNAPFAIIAGVHALTWLQEKLQRHSAVKWAVLVVAVSFMTVSFRKSDLSMPWLKANPLHQAGMVMPICEVERGNTAYTVGLGAGYQLITNDEYMLLTGHLFYPWYIRDIKRIQDDWRCQQKTVLDSVPTSDILTLEWGVSAPHSFKYMTDGYRFRQLEGKPETYCYTLSGPQHDLHFWRIVMPGELKESEQLVNYLDSVSSEFLGDEAYILAASNHYGTSHFMEELVPTGRLEKKAERLYKIIKK